MKLLRIAAAVGCLLGLSGFTSTSVTFDGLAVLPDIKPIKVSGRLGKPDGEAKRPALLLLVTCGGSDDTIAKVWPQYLAGLGYVTLVVDYVHSRGQKTCGRPMPLLAERAQLVGDIYGGVKYLSTLPYVDAARIGTLGFSMGAIMNSYISNLNLKTPEGVGIKAIASFYGYCTKAPPERGQIYPGGAPTIPWLILDGTKETPSFLTSCAPFKQYPNVEMHIFDGAYHGWDQERLTKISFDDGGNAMLYNAKVTAESREILKAWLAKNL
jgi:dienelactone hydrolase